MKWKLFFIWYFLLVGTCGKMQPIAFWKKDATALSSNDYLHILESELWNLFIKFILKLDAINSPVYSTALTCSGLACLSGILPGLHHFFKNS